MFYQYDYNEKCNHLKEKLSKGFPDTILPTEMATASSIIDLNQRYRWAIKKTEMEAAKKVRLTGVQNYWRRICQVEIDLD